MALLVVLWFIVSAVLLVSSFNAAVSSGAAFVASELQLTKAEALLDAGAEIAATRLIDEAEERRWPADGKRRRVTFGAAELTIAIDDPNGLIDLNKADPKLLLAFLRQFAGSEMKAGQLRDLIMRARDEASGKKGGEGPQPAASDADGDQGEKTAKALAFMDIAQLRRMEGMTADIYRQIAPFITVYSRDGRINPLGAPNEVLSCIPNLTKIDIERVRDALKAGRDNDTALTDIMQRARSSLSDAAGPAYIVTVEARTASDKYRAGKVFVIATGLDRNAPYRLISKKPVMLTGMTP